MTVAQNILLERLEGCPYTAFKLPDHMKPTSEYKDFELKLRLFNEDLHESIGWFFDKYPNVGLFAGDEFNRFSKNAWMLSLITCVGTSLGDTYMYGKRIGDAGDFLFNYMEFASSMSDGSVGICRAPENFGKVAYCTFNACSERGNVPIVANSFTEWLERTLDAGPDAECFYWEKPDYRDLGPAIPDDPYYEPIGRV